MNQRQRLVLILAFLVVCGMALFPPWKAPTDYGEADAGYKLVFWPSHGHTLARVDSARLAAQLIAVVALAGAAYLILRRSREWQHAKSTTAPAHSLTPL